MYTPLCCVCSIMAILIASRNQWYFSIPIIQGRFNHMGRSQPHGSESTTWVGVNHMGRSQPHGSESTTWVGVNHMGRSQPYDHPGTSQVILNKRSEATLKNRFIPNHKKTEGTDREHTSRGMLHDHYFSACHLRERHGIQFHPILFLFARYGANKSWLIRCCLYVRKRISVNII